MIDIKVFEIKVKTFLLENIKFEDSLEQMGSIIDSTLIQNEQFKELHENNKYKNYCFSSLMPIEKDKVYKKGKIYDFIIRTVDIELAKFLECRIKDQVGIKLKCLTSETKIIPKHHISEIYTITPVIVKTSEGYWKNSISLDKYESLLKINLIKKARQLGITELDENEVVFENLEFTNRRPIGNSIKNVKLLGDKIKITIADNHVAQELAYISLGAGIGEIGSRGYGFVNYQWLRR